MHARLLAAALLFLGVLSGVAHASTPYAWEAVGNPNTLTKHCLCRMIRNGGWPVDHVIQNSLLIKPCFKYCRGQLGDGAELCAVYKREHNGQWALANRQPDGSDTCDMYVRTDKTLAEWVTARTANPPTSQERNTIHMFWWGDPTADKHRQSAMLGATALEKELHQHGYTIKYHHQKTATAFTDGKVPSLPSNVQQVTIGSGGDVASVGNYLDGTDLSTNVDAINAIVGSYAFYGVKGYAALKDLAILCILYKQGGIFLDTSVQIFDGTSHQQLDAALKDFTDESFPKYPLLWDRSQIEFVKSAAGNTVPFYKIEYNGAWVPKNHPATKTTILQYIALAAKLGLNTGGQSSDSEVHKKWTVVDRGHARMVGETIRSSVVTGLGTFAHDAPVNTAYLVFDTERPMKSDGITTDGSRLMFTPMKITKIYGGLWKESTVKVSTTTVLEELDELANDIDLL